MDEDHIMQSIQNQLTNANMQYQIQLKELHEWIASLSPDAAENLDVLLTAVLMGADNADTMCNYWRGILTASRMTNHGHKPWGELDAVDDASITSFLEGAETPLDGPESAS